ncbi:ABC transporter permease [[Mycoplasma] testudinis]|uniref:ABC transporter permease n=1 Tax=[Mycoplasma] testudinis TaxID=33924 RepID=UPI000483207C|nr:ABC transporter permease [[Mycoplasma] testudinis]
MKPLLLLYSYKFVKNPLNIVFSVLWPIAWIIISYFAWGRGFQEGINGFSGNANFFIFTAPGYFLMAATSISLANVPNTIAADRIYNRVKIFRTLNINRTQYIFTHCIVNFSVFLFVFLVQLLISNFAFELNLSASTFFSIFFLDLFAFILMLFLALFLSQFGKTDRSINLIGTVVFYPILFLSGNSIPAFSIDPNGVWFKYVQFLEPVGGAAYFSQNIILQDTFGFSQIDWKVDWLGIIIPVAEAVIFGLITWKIFKWK